MRLAAALIVLGCLVAVPVAAFAASAPPPAAAQKSESAAPQRTDSTAEYHLSPAQYERAVKYARARYTLYFVGTFWGFLVLALVLGLRLASRLRDLVERISRRRFVQTIFYVTILSIGLALVSLPLDAIGHALAVKYDQSVQGWGSWLGDAGKGQLIAIVIGSPIAWLLYTVIRKSPRRWWLWFWLASAPIVILLMFVAPVVIEPMFYKFVPLKASQPELTAALEKVATRGGLAIPPERMFEMKASQKLKSINAYVDGFGASERVVVWDTTIAKATTPQILFVFGHEMGHYVLGHIYKGIAFALGGLLIAFGFGYWGMGFTLRRFGERFRIRDAGDLASLPLFLLLVSLLGFVGSPISNAFSRHEEHQADVFGLEVTHGLVPRSREAAIGAFQVLGEVDLADPAPSRFIKWWLYDHPPLAERIAFARQYDPWSTGAGPRYVK